MRKIIALAMPLVFLSLITVQANAVIIPVEVERLKDVYFIRVRGDPHTGFSLHYVNLSPDIQTVSLSGVVCNPMGWCMPFCLKDPVPVEAGSSWDFSRGGGHGYTMCFKLIVVDVDVIEGSVAIPPPP